MKSDEALLAFRARRRQLVVEIVAAFASAAGLLLVAAPIEVRATPDVRALFVSVCVLFAVCTVALVTRAVPLLLFRCPRCREPFHGPPVRALVALLGSHQACAHCRMGARPEGERKRTAP